MAASISITIDQGARLHKTIYHKRDQYGNAVDLSGESAVATMKRNYAANTGFSLGVELDVNGGVTLTANSSVTAAIPPGWYVYDVLLLNSVTEDYERILQGVALVSPGVSQPGSTPLWSDDPPPAPAGEGGGTPATPV